MHYKVHFSLYVVLFFGTYGVSSINAVSLEDYTASVEKNPIVEYMLQKYVAPRLELSLKNTQNDTNQLISIINNIFGSAILNENGDNIQIDYNNLKIFVKQQGRNALTQIIGTNDIILSILAQHRLSSSLDHYFSPLEGSIRNASFPVRIQSRQRRAVPPGSLETVLVNNVFSNLIGPFIGPIQIFVNQSLVSVGLALADLRQQPTTAADFFTSIRVSLINEAITQVINFVETIRNQLNIILAPLAPTPAAPRAIFKRAASTEIGTTSTRSAIDILLSPLRFLAGIILGPLHNILRSVITNTFVNLRPVVGGIILGPLESLLQAIVNLIPCTNC
ncbi:hypothetical protein WA026_009278 [Henosepilachna vigintioctopunctata]|uniref:Uncharacterized protein n=1 Tax=Henosepilachna vigintioctopunctata TaxID=420089 RepID=A0AAW1UR96_9CUCU